MSPKKNLVDNPKDLNTEGLYMYDNYIGPFISSVIKQIPIISKLLTFQKDFINKKCTLFVKYLSEKNDRETLENIKNLNHEARGFILQVFYKTINMDDDLQIFILANLTKNYLVNNELNYYEKSLFYNISQFSKDDFLIFADKMNSISPIEDTSNSYEFFTMNNFTDIEKIIFRKFLNIGMIIYDKVGRIGFQGGENFLKSDYADSLIALIENYKIEQETERGEL